MRFPDEALKCVVFLGTTEIARGKEIDIEPKGTGFFLSGDSGVTFLITARHVAEKLYRTRFGIRMNTRTGSYGVHFFDELQWEYHPESDVAIGRIAIPNWADVVPFPLKWMATPFKMVTKNFGPGDLVYVTGLFHRLYGDLKNFVIVHTGNVALIPAEQIKISDGQNIFYTDGYIVESQAISGASGSPVFIRRSIETQVPNKQTDYVRSWVHGTLWLLGLWSSSHWGAPDKTLVSGSAQQPEKVSMGLGVVVPCKPIMELLTILGCQEAARSEDS